jgi:hypothetical protein
MPDWIGGAVLALLGAGFGISVLSILRGVDITRGRTAKTEAQGIGYLQRSVARAEWRQHVATHRLEYYRDEQNPYLRNRIGDLEYIIRVELGRDKIPPWEPEPMMRPLPARPPELMRGDDTEDDRADAAAGTDG